MWLLLYCRCYLVKGNQTTAYLMGHGGLLAGRLMERRLAGRRGFGYCACGPGLSPGIGPL